ncbi:MAG: CAP domain-containing protein [Acidobacteria bacterium]|nr:CAP domain-containing protein [Acidobacteriota bacterium]
MLKRSCIVPVLVLLLLSPSPAAFASGSSPTRAERQMISLINRDRKAAKLPALRTNSTLTRIARDQAARMADSGEVSHNEWLFGRAGRRHLRYPKALGENVGAGGGVRAVHEGFMASEPHRDNILRKTFTQMGVGILEADGGIWVSQVFVRPSDRRSAVGFPPRAARGREPRVPDPSPAWDRASPAREKGPALPASVATLRAEARPVLPDDRPLRGVPLLPLLCVGTLTVLGLLCRVRRPAFARESLPGSSAA